MSNERYLPGFANPIDDAQRSFRTVLNAMSRPTLPYTLDAVKAETLRVPHGWNPAVAAIALTLCDESTPMWLGARGTDTELVAWLRRLTGAPVTHDLAQALFVFVGADDEMPAFDLLNWGTDEQPSDSATVVIDVSDTTAKTTAHSTTVQTVKATGPGVKGQVEWVDCPLTSKFLTQHHGMRGQFPRGIDFLFVDGAQVRGLPRTTQLTTTERTTQSTTQSTTMQPEEVMA